MAPVPGSSCQGLSCNPSRIASSKESKTSSRSGTAHCPVPRLVEVEVAFGDNGDEIVQHRVETQLLDRVIDLVTLKRRLERVGLCCMVEDPAQPCRALLSTCARAGRSGPIRGPSGSARPSWPACGRW